MHIGIINFEMAPAGVNQLLHKVISELLYTHTVTGVRLDQRSGVLTYKNFAEENISGAFVDFKNVLQLSPLSEDLSVYDALGEFDAILAIGPQQVASMVEMLRERLGETRCLFIPVSIYNNVEGTDLSLGYDTALNYMIESILRIRDTIDSLKYPNPRLLGVQLGAKAPKHVLDEVALAVNGHVLHHDFDDGDVLALKTKLQKEFALGHTHAFLLFDERIAAERIPNELLVDIAIDWKTHGIDEALCMGPDPTAQDRIIAMKLAGAILEWVENNRTGGKLLFQAKEAQLQLD
ncbi:6-phosphofructokinase [Virgibacillus senegalensis]|uniref:6-phosphofructokinase n=1 Tax=Virgibacillus senegalensis TaxID=1499679 RepID=UPI00069F0316|nr:6-phosphofructokinase [Virgibacillus senegalensis]